MSVSPDARFESLYRAHAGRVKAYALRRSDQATADDVVAEVFLVVWRRLDDVPEPALPWLLGVARRVLANRRRGEGRIAALRQRLLGAESRLDVDPADLAGADGAAWIALATLSAGDRELLTLAAWEGLSVGEIAEALGLRPNTVSVRLHRARQRFAAALARHENSTLQSVEA